MGKGLVGCIVMTGALLVGCASSKEPNPDVELQELVQMYGGHYENSAQVQAEIAKGVKPHESLALDIVPIDAIMIGHDVFYVQESIAGDPKRVLGQKVVMFGVVKKKIVQTDFSLAEPYRWRNGQYNPDLFKAIMTTDVRSTKGCSLNWKRAESGDFEGANNPKTCHTRANVGGIAAIESKAELSPVEYSTAEIAYDKPGHVAAGRPDDPYYRFRKVSHEAD